MLDECVAGRPVLIFMGSKEAQKPQEILSADCADFHGFNIFFDTDWH